MDLSKCFNQNKFNDYKNIYTIMMKRTRNGKIRHIPIYGHFYNNANNFMYKIISNNEIQDAKNVDNYRIAKYEDLAKDIHNNYYEASNIESLLSIIKELNSYESKKEP